MKRVPAWLIPVAVLVGLAFLEARADYSWAGAFLRDAERNGWTLAGASANLIDPTHPWTLFKKPTIGLWFVRKGTLSRAANGHVLAEVLQASNPHLVDDHASRTYQERFDCVSHRMVIVDPSRPKELEWSEMPPGSPGLQVIGFVCGLRVERGLIDTVQQWCSRIAGDPTLLDPARFDIDAIRDDLVRAYDRIVLDLISKNSLGNAPPNNKAIRELARLRLAGVWRDGAHLHFADPFAAGEDFTNAVQRIRGWVYSGVEIGPCLPAVINALFQDVTVHGADETATLVLRYSLGLKQGQ